MKIIPVPVLSDNYSYLLIDSERKIAAAIDPAEPEKVLKSAHDNGVIVTSILTTHHHKDHSGGNEEFAKKVGIPVYGGDERVLGLTKKVSDGDFINVGSIKISVLSTPCHTSGHIVFYAEEGEDTAVFTGDTLFVAGCGRFFEGDAKQMYHSLIKTIGKLPGKTKVYCGHEYTINNLKFAKTVEPKNLELIQKLEWAEKQVAEGKPTIPSTIQEEKSYNPFMRVEHASIADGLGLPSLCEPVKVMAELRTRKDNF